MFCTLGQNKASIELAELSVYLLKFAIQRAVVSTKKGESERQWTAIGACTVTVVLIVSSPGGFHLVHFIEHLGDLVPERVSTLVDANGGVRAYLQPRQSEALHV